MLKDRQIDKNRTNEPTELHQFWKESSYDGDLSPCQVWIPSAETEIFTDKQTKNGQINGRPT